MKRVSILEYGAGNLHSLAKALAGPATSVSTMSDVNDALSADILVLPGVGNFAQAAERLAPARDAIRSAIARGVPTIGICLGMQLLFESSEEGAGRGLGVIAGNVTRLRATRVPQIGWSSIDDARDAAFASAPLAHAYFAHSFACRPSDDSSVAAWTSHDGDRFPAMVRHGSAIGVQFHPEKSGAAGVEFLRALVAAVAP